MGRGYGNHGIGASVSIAQRLVIRGDLHDPSLGTVKSGLDLSAGCGKVPGYFVFAHDSDDSQGSVAAGGCDSWQIAVLHDRTSGVDPPGLSVFERVAAHVDGHPYSRGSPWSAFLDVPQVAVKRLDSVREEDAWQSHHLHG